MTRTPHLQLDYLMPDQAQKHVTLNDALRRLDGLVQLSVRSSVLTAPPPDPQAGDRYLTAAGATDAWAGQDGRLALYEDTAWHFFAPAEGWRLWDESRAALLAFSGGSWLEIGRDPAKPNLFGRKDFTVDLSRPDVQATIPSHIMLLGVSARVLETVTGPVSWNIGVHGDAKRFAHSISLLRGSRVIGPNSKQLVQWSETPLLFTGNDGDISSGRLAVAVFFLTLLLPELDQS